MKKKILTIGITIVILIVVGFTGFCFWVQYQKDPKNLGIKPKELSSVVTDDELAKHNSDLERIYGFSKKDVSQKDLSQVSIERISNISFDEYTKWPEESKLPKNFNPNIWFETRKRSRT